MVQVESIGEALSRLAEAAPDSPALTIGDLTLSRSDLDRRSNRTARAMLADGVQQGDLVTIALPNSAEFFEAAIACWKIGAVPQPVSWRLPDRELEAIVEVANSALVVGVAADRMTDRLCWEPGHVVDATLDDSPLPSIVTDTWKAPTSGGSTGRPKLILSGDPSTVPAEPSRGMICDGCVLIPGPLYHNAPFTFASLGLFYGNHVVLMAKFDAEATLEAIDRYRPDFMLVVPTMMIRILRLADDVRGRYDVSSLRTVWHMGAPCPPWAKRAWIDWLGGETIWELYAGTESQAVSTVRGDEWLARPGTVGRVAIGEMKVVDADSLEDVPAGEIGEIFMRWPVGQAPTYRYLGAEARTMPGGWESLGDLGWFDDQGYLFLADRQADMILCGGANVYPAEIEAALDEHPAVQSCAVIGLPHDELGQVVHAILHCTPGTDPPDDDDLKRFVAARLVSYKVPRSFEWVTDSVRDDAGKVRRGALLEERISS